MSVRAVIELSGHIIDSMVLPRVMDSVMDMGRPSTSRSSESAPDSTSPPLRG